MIDPEYDAPEYCCACLCQLNSNAFIISRCTRCGLEITAPGTVLTADQYARRSREDADMWRSAEASGLIRPQGISESGE